MKFLYGGKKRLPGIMRAFFMLALVAGAAAASYARTAVWRDEITLWSDVIKKSPAKARGYVSIGLAYSRRKEYLKAMENYDRALQLDPDNKWLHFNLGLFFLNPAFRNLERSRQEFEEVLMQNPGDAKATAFLRFVLQLQQSGQR